MSLVAHVHHFFGGGVAIFSHESEQEVEEFVSWFLGGVLGFRLELRRVRVLCRPMPCGMLPCSAFS